MWRPAEVDRIVGDATELAVKQTIGEFFKDGILQKQGEYDVIDFLGDRYAYEVKTVCFEYGKYNSVLVTCEKLKRYQRRYTQDLYIVYKFNDDSIYYIKYDTEQFSKYKIGDVKRKDRNYKTARSCNHIFIPLDDLKPLREKTHRCLIDFGA